MSDDSTSPYTVEDLNRRLVAAREAYYSGTPILSDAVYDELELQLAELVKAHPEESAQASVLITVGTSTPTSGRIPHDHPMRSIENIYTEEALHAWAAKLGWPALTLGPKFDGISCSLTYENGNLVKAVTRGDGDAGESILDQVRAVTSIPKQIKLPVKIEVRGELVITRSSMERLNTQLVEAGLKPYMSTRNLVAGTMKLHDLKEVERRDVSFLPWEVLFGFSLADGDGDSALDRLVSLSEYGFARPHDLCVGESSLTHALAMMTPALSDSEREIACDGLVLKVDYVGLRKDLGVGSKFANFQVAYKLQNARTESVLRDVIWQVGRQGRLTPVAVIDPVVLAGAVIERVTLNNLTWIRTMGLQIGSRVEVVRSGDVIPQIVRVCDE